MTSQSQIKGVSQSSTPTVVPEGSLWYDTSNDVLKASDGTTYNQIGRTSFSNAAVASHSTTLTDYSLPTASYMGTTLTLGDQIASYSTQGAADAAFVSSDTAENRANITNDNLDIGLPTDATNNAISYDFGSGIISDTAWILRFKLRFSALTQGAQANFWLGMSSVDSSNDSSANRDFIGMQTTNAVGTTDFGCQEKDAQALTGEASVDAKTLAWAISTDYYFEIARSSATAMTVKYYSDAAYTTLVSTSTNSSVPATVTGLRYFFLGNQIGAGAGDWTGTIDNIVLFNGVTSGATVTPSSNLINGDTTKRGATASITNPNMTVDIGATSNICAVAMYWDATNTTETEMKIQTSIDNSTFTDKRTITTSNLTNAAWNYYRFNVAGGARYVRFYGTGTSKIISMYEVKVLKKTDAELFSDLGIVAISASDTALDSDGI